MIDGEKVLLAKPTTFYNVVGESYRSLIDFYKVTPEDTIILHDELALPFGTIRARVGGSDAGNNGIKSINQHGGENSMRLRIGVANEKRAVIGDTDFVLARFTADELRTLKSIVIPKCNEMVHSFIHGNHQSTSHTLIDKSATTL